MLREPHGLDGPGELPGRLEGYRILQRLPSRRVLRPGPPLLLAEPLDRPGFRVALKDYGVAGDDRPDSREAAAQQAVAVWNDARWLRHRGIVRVYRPVAPGYLAIEWVPGRTIHDQVYDQARDRPLAAADAARLVVTLAEALAYMSAELSRRIPDKPMVGHSDVAPKNVMIVPGEDGPEAKLLDLDGIGRPLRRQIPLPEPRRREALAMGRGIWKPPECTLGTVPYYDSCANVFTLGVLCYRLLLGRPPFAAPDEYLRLLERLLAGEADLLPSRIAQVRTTGLGRVLARMTQLARDRRYPSVAAALPELRQALAAVVARAAAQA